MEKKPLVSMIILAWNGRTVLRKNLESLKRFFGREEYELIVVDNGSTDETPKILEEYKNDLRIIKNTKNLGFAAGNNVGIKTAQGKYILLLNQDVECIGDAIEKMVAFLEDHPQYGAVAPQLLYPDGRVQISCRPFYGWKTFLLELLTLGIYKNRFYDHNRSQDVDQPMASVLMIRGELLKKLEGFDDHQDFWLYFNDVDLSYRIHQAGFRHYFLSEAKFYHHHGQSAYNLKNFKRTWLWHRGLRRFFLKHIIKSKWSFQYLTFVGLSVLSYLLVNLAQGLRGAFSLSRKDVSAIRRRKS
ncbi:MAG: glycosyltransferase family 2 protein [Candidatus Moranbacteria bacterium]|nr:glycosyltransferase family 2 protein [Candidatus Moranbacteria bacterium]